MFLSIIILVRVSRIWIQMNIDLQVSRAHGFIAIPLLGMVFEKGLILGNEGMQ
jgi:hypothetical protein